MCLKLQLTFFFAVLLCFVETTDIVDAFEQKLENVFYSTECIEMSWVFLGSPALSSS